MVALLLCSSLTGCLSRRMTIRSNPPGALVLVDGKEVGYTPTAIDFTYYGTREITLVKDGFETLTTLQKVRTPWYERFPLDFVSENFVPAQITDRHEFFFEMQPSVVVPTQDLLERANGLRTESQLGGP